MHVFMATGQVSKTKNNLQETSYKTQRTIKHAFSETPYNITREPCADV